MSDTDHETPTSTPTRANPIVRMLGAVPRFFTRSPSPPPLTDPAKIDRLYRRCRNTSIGAVAIGYGCSYTCRLGLAAVKKPLLDAGRFDADQLGAIGSSFFYIYAVGKFINGFFADHVNIRRFFAFGVAVSALCNLAMGRSTSMLAWALLWGVNGWVQAHGAPTGAVTVSRWFGSRERGSSYGIFATSHCIGEGLSFAALPAIVAALGWRWGFWLPGAWCLVVALLIYVLLQDRPEARGLPPVSVWRNDPPPAQATPPGSTFRTQLRVLKQPAIWVVGLASACLYMTRYSIDSWGLLFLQADKGYTAVKAGGLLWINTTAGIFGSIAFGFLSDRLFGARRPPTNLLYAVLELIALCIVFFVAKPGDTALISAGLALYGFCLGGLNASLGGLFAVDLAPKRAAGAAMGVTGIFSYLGAAVQERVSGHLIERGTTFVEGVRVYDFHAAVLFWFAASVVSALLAASLWRVRSVE